MPCGMPCGIGISAFPVGPIALLGMTTGGLLTASIREGRWKSTRQHKMYASQSAVAFLSNFPSKNV